MGRNLKAVCILLSLSLGITFGGDLNHDASIVPPEPSSAHVQELASIVPPEPSTMQELASIVPPEPTKKMSHRT